MAINELQRVITYGIIEKEFQVQKFKMRMRTLTAGEMRKITEDLSGFDDVAKFRGVQIKTLAYSILGVNGKKVEYTPENEQDSITEEKRYRQNETIIEKWQKSMVDLFYSKYMELQEEQESFLLESEKPSTKGGVGNDGKSPNTQE